MTIAGSGDLLCDLHLLSFLAFKADCFSQPCLLCGTGCLGAAWGGGHSFSTTRSSAMSSAMP